MNRRHYCNNMTLRGRQNGLTAWITTLLLLTQPSDTATPPSRPRKSHRVRFIQLAVPVIIAVIVAVFLAGTYDLFSPGVNPDERETWERWGMRIEYPAGLNAVYKGGLGAEANEQSGIVEWVWNKGNSRLSLAWSSTRSFDHNSVFERMPEELETTYGPILVEVFDEGIVTIDGHEWQYRTWVFELEGVRAYTTSALRFYEAQGRAVMLSFMEIRNSPNILDSFMKFAETFELG